MLVRGGCSMVMGRLMINTLQLSLYQGPSTARLVMQSIITTALDLRHHTTAFRYGPGCISPSAPAYQTTLIDTSIPPNLSQLTILLPIHNSHSNIPVSLPTSASPNCTGNFLSNRALSAPSSPDPPAGTFTYGLPRVKDET